ncbi:MAG: sigma-70 family RNA polymerase sigma factor [Planctomycetes bacterium]|nr:sigma-70 family RNA polymerase sigma factor [Planctomycetota bacterium]
MTPSTHARDVDELLRHSDWVRSLARRLVDDDATRDDLVQETWLAALTRRPAVVLDWRKWLAAVLRNVLLQRRRSSARRRVREGRAAAPEALPGAAGLVAEAEQQRELVGAVLALDEPYRGTLLLKYFDDLSAVEIAKRAGIPTSTVRSRLNRGLALLRARYDERFGGDRRAWVSLLLPLARRGEVAGSLSLKVLAGVLLMNLKLAVTAALVVAAGVSGVLWTMNDRPTRPHEMPELGSQATPPAVDTPAVAAATAARENEAPAEREEAWAEVAAATAAAADASDRVGYAGTVIKATGERVLLPGVKITVVAKDAEGSYGRTEHVVYSDEHGAFHVPQEVPRDGSCRLLAELKGYVATSRAYLKDVLPLIALERGAMVYGRVLNRDTGNPIAGARVERAGPESSWLEPAVADASGAYRIEDVPCGTFEFSVSPPGGCALYERIELGGPGEHRHDIGIAVGPVLRVRATDLETGLPVAGASVFANHRLAGRTDGAGVLDLSMPSDRAMHIDVTADGYCGCGRRFDPTAMDRNGEARFPLLRACTLEGIVVDPDGRPVKGATVSVEGFRAEKAVLNDPRVKAVFPDDAVISLLSRSFPRTDQEGRFTLAGLCPFVDYETIQVRERQERYSTTLDPIRFERSGETRSITVQFRIAAVVYGRVTWNGKGVGASIDTIDDKGRAVAGEDGRYLLELTKSGPVKIYAHASAIYCQRLVEIDVAPDERRQLDFAFQGELSRVEGRLVDSSGRPVAGKQVNLKWEGGPVGIGNFSDQDGRFSDEIPLSPGQTFTVLVSHGPVRLSRDGLVAGAPSVDIVLPDLGKAILRIVEEPACALLTAVACDWRAAGTDDEYRWLSCVEERADQTLALTLPVGVVDLRIKRPLTGKLLASVEGVRVSLDPEPTPIDVRIAAK